ncbi:MAG: hypothetical protein AB7H48_00790 [Parachlamydiales bacterium]
MSKPSKSRFFRTFSANDWNHPESCTPFFKIFDSQRKTTSTFSSNAEKLRKIEFRKIKEN